MSVPAFAWAIEKGIELCLSPSERLLLLYMADQANCSGVFCTGQPKMVEATGLCLRTVRTLIPRLAQRHLISIDARPGLPTTYRIMRQPNGVDTPATIAAPARDAAPAKAAQTPATIAAPPRQPLPDHPGKISTPPRQLTTGTPATIAPDPYLPKKRTQDARAPAREEGKIFEGREEGPPPPTPPPPDTTADWFNDPKPETALPSRVIDRPAANGEAKAQAQEANPPDPLMAAKLAGLVASLARSCQNNYPPRLTALTRDEQIDIARPQRPKPRYLPPEYLAVIRQAAGYGVRVS